VIKYLGKRILAAEKFHRSILIPRFQPRDRVDTDFSLFSEDGWVSSSEASSGLLDREIAGFVQFIFA